MKFKLQSSPHKGTKEEYSAEIKAKMGIDLDLDKISPNPALTKIFKLCMNSVREYICVICRGWWVVAVATIMNFFF